jgi:para-aminobenzoate synthetase / 4-amino-4-deoxychorismate lyase
MLVRFDSLDLRRGYRSFLFEDPVETLSADRLADVPRVLERVEAVAREGRFAAGYVAYEAGAAFDRAFAIHPPSAALPLAWFTVFRARREVEPLAAMPSGSNPEGLRPLDASVDGARYESRVRRILDYIAAGDAYQVNYTLRLRGEQRHPDPLALYRQLALSQRSAFCAFLEVGRTQILSASPELFFQLEGRRITTRPMKGTRPRGRWVDEDESLAAALATSPKDRAENLMIVDLIRNDLGRVSEFGSVRVPTLYEVERYPTVYQLTSTVCSMLRPGVSIPDVFRALFPSGSVTGAPKLRASEIIRDLEDGPRGVYTGAIGFVGPEEAVFSVAIRTLIVDSRSGTMELGVGSGITADSDPAAEYDECLGKAAFVHRAPDEFDLIEALRLEVPGGYPLLADHLERLSRSARYFDFPVSMDGVRNALEERAASQPPGCYKVRLRVTRAGVITTSAEPIVPGPEPLRLRVASARVDASDPFLYHKSSRRDVYDRARAEWPDADDVLLVNQRGEITESTTANVVVTLEGVAYTPPLDAGLLDGVLRRRLLEEGRIRERPLTVADLEGADGIHLVNSVRGWREALLSH